MISPQTWLEMHEIKKTTLHPFSQPPSHSPPHIAVVKPFTNKELDHRGLDAPASCGDLEIRSRWPTDPDMNSSEWRELIILFVIYYCLANFSTIFTHVFNIYALISTCFNLKPMGRASLFWHVYMLPWHVYRQLANFLNWPVLENFHCQLCHYMEVSWKLPMSIMSSKRWKMKSWNGIFKWAHRMK